MSVSIARRGLYVNVDDEIEEISKLFGGGAASWDTAMDGVSTLCQDEFGSDGSGASTASSSSSLLLPSSASAMQSLIAGNSSVSGGSQARGGAGGGGGSLGGGGDDDGHHHHHHHHHHDHHDDDEHGLAKRAAFVRVLHSTKLPYLVALNARQELYVWSTASHGLELVHVAKCSGASKLPVCQLTLASTAPFAFYARPGSAQLYCTPLVPAAGMTVPKYEAKRPLVAIGCHPSTTIVAIATSDGHVRLIDYTSGTVRCSSTDFAKAATAAAAAAHQQDASSGDDDDDGVGADDFDADARDDHNQHHRSMHELNHYRRHRSNEASVPPLSPLPTLGDDGDELLLTAAAAADGGELLRAASMPKCLLFDRAVNANMLRLYCASADGTLAVWRVDVNENGEWSMNAFVSVKLPAPLRSLAMSRYGFVLTLLADSTLCAYELMTLSDSIFAFRPSGVLPRTSVSSVHRDVCERDYSGEPDHVRVRRMIASPLSTELLFLFEGSRSLAAWQQHALAARRRQHQLQQQRQPTPPPPANVDDDDDASSADGDDPTLSSVGSKVSVARRAKQLSRALYALDQRGNAELMADPSEALEVCIVFSLVDRMRPDRLLPVVASMSLPALFFLQKKPVFNYPSSLIMYVQSDVDVMAFDTVRRGNRLVASLEPYHAGYPQRVLRIVYSHKTVQMLVFSEIDRGPSLGRDYRVALHSRAPAPGASADDVVKGGSQSNQSGRDGLFVGPSHSHYLVLSSDGRKVALNPARSSIEFDASRPVHRIFAGPVPTGVLYYVRSQNRVYGSHGVSDRYAAALASSAGGGASNPLASSIGPSASIGGTSHSPYALDASRHLQLRFNGGDDIEELVDIVWRVHTVPSSDLAVVVTTQRILIVGCQFRVLAGVHAPSSCPTLIPFSSAVWIDTCVLYATETHLCYLTLDGTHGTVCSLLGAESAVLVAVYNDHAYYAAFERGETRIKSQAIGLLEPLLMGLLALPERYLLASTGIKSADDIVELYRRAVRRFDNVRITTRLVECLRRAGRHDIALALIKNAEHQSSQLKFLLAIDSHQFETAFELLRERYRKKRDIFYRSHSHYGGVGGERQQRLAALRLARHRRRATHRHHCAAHAAAADTEPPRRPLLDLQIDAELLATHCSSDTIYYMPTPSSAAVGGSGGGDQSSPSPSARAGAQHELAIEQSLRCSAASWSLPRDTKLYGHFEVLAHRCAQYGQFELARRCYVLMNDRLALLHLYAIHRSRAGVEAVLQVARRDRQPSLIEACERLLAMRQLDAPAPSALSPPQRGAADDEPVSSSSTTTDDDSVSGQGDDEAAPADVATAAAKAAVKADAKLIAAKSIQLKNWSFVTEAQNWDPTALTSATMRALTDSEYKDVQPIGFLDSIEKWLAQTQLRRLNANALFSGDQQPPRLARSDERVRMLAAEERAERAARIPVVRAKRIRFDAAPDVDSLIDIGTSSRTVWSTDIKTSASVSDSVADAHAEGNNGDGGRDDDDDGADDEDDGEFGELAQLSDNDDDDDNEDGDDASYDMDDPFSIVDLIAMPLNDDGTSAARGKYVPPWRRKRNDKRSALDAPAAPASTSSSAALSSVPRRATVSTSSPSAGALPPPVAPLPPASSDATAASALNRAARDQKSAIDYMRTCFEHLSTRQYPLALESVNHSIRLLTQDGGADEHRLLVKFCAAYKLALKILIEMKLIHQSSNKSRLAALAVALADAPIDPKHRVAHLATAIDTCTAGHDHTNAKRLIKLMLSLDNPPSADKYRARLAELKRSTSSTFSSSAAPSSSSNAPPASPISETALIVPTRYCFHSLEPIAPTASCLSCDYCETNYSEREKKVGESCPVCSHGKLRPASAPIVN
jgi:hypothetical protein